MAAAASPSPLMVPRVLWGALLTSTFIYVYVYFTVAPQAAAPPEPVMAMALGVVALITAVVSFVLPARLHRAAVMREKPEIEEVPDPDASVMFRDQTPTIRVFAEAREAQKRAFQLYYTPFIMSLALTEAVAIYGLVLGFTGWGPSVVLPFFGVAWVLFLPRFPRSRAALEPFEKAHDARFPAGVSVGVR